MNDIPLNLNRMNLNRMNDIPLNLNRMNDIHLNTNRMNANQANRNQANRNQANNYQNIQNPNTNLFDHHNGFVDALYALYHATHIIPTDQDFLSQINNYPLVYNVLYWLKLEHLYPQFVEEEMDLEAIRLMEPNDLVYFNVDQSELFIQFVQWLQ